MFEIGKELCSDLSAAMTREWLETNGMGGFASSTIIGLNTRRYHGLLTAATKPPVGRLLLLSKLEETLIIDGHRYDLSCNQYTGAIHPQGHQYMTHFSLSPNPVFRYEVCGLEIIKSVLMIHGQNTTIVEYEVRDTDGNAIHSDSNLFRQCQLEVRPLIAFRDYHGTTHENSALNPDVKIKGTIATVSPYQGLPSINFAHDANELNGGAYWYRNFEYAVEQERGLDYLEDLFSPFALRFDLTHRNDATIIASTEPHSIDRAMDLRRSELQRRKTISLSTPVDDELVEKLVAATDQYIVARGDQKTVIAGYHWFSDWGRDTMIALPGLTLVTGRFEIAKSILLAFAKSVSQGMLPNRFPDEGEDPEYNTVDATLWFFEAIRSLLHYTKDALFVKEHLYAVLKEIIDWHVNGTRYGIKVDEDGLLNSGAPGVQLTWMDARIGDWVVTPRYGKAVEIQALWYNALCAMRDLANRFGEIDRAKQYEDIATKASNSFNNLFWNEAAGCLYDAVNGPENDGSIRPNQILAVSLFHSMLSHERAKRVTEVVERELLTPVGLRSLAKNDPKYAARYEGDMTSRDSVYHQGTVWAWLMGPFITAYLKVNDRSDQALSRIKSLLAGFNEHLNEAMIGHISEIFDGDAPHQPRGCAAQAWSVSEILRAIVENVYEVNPLLKKTSVAKQ